MTSKGVVIKYGDFAPEAKENFVTVASEKADFVDLSEFQRYNVDIPNYINPCETYVALLDGSGTPFPESPENEDMGYWSRQASFDAKNTLHPYIVFTLTSEGQYTSQGLTFTFDTAANVFPTQLNIKWYRDTSAGLELLADVEFKPDNAVYFCKQYVENYNRIVITFKYLNMAHARLKVRAIDFGYGTYFEGNELRSVKVIQGIDPLSSEIEIATVDFTLDSKSDMEYSFQAKQPLSVYFNGQLRATTFVKSSRRKARFLWDVKSEDYIGIMDGVPFAGGMYSAKNASELLTEIFTAAKVPFEIDEAISGMTVTGYIPYTTCRDALIQVAFALQLSVITSGLDVVRVGLWDNNVTQIIPLNRIMQGQSFTSDETVTGVELASHTYTPKDEFTDVYKAEDSGIGDNITVKFSQPLHSLKITNGDIVSQGTNYAVINARSGCVLKGKTYEHVETLYRYNNPVVLASEIENVKSISSATLVSPDKVAELLPKCFEWLSKTDTTNLKIVEGKHVDYETEPPTVTYDMPVNIGEVIGAETEYKGVKKGRILKQSYNLNGNIIIKESVIK